MAISSCSKEDPAIEMRKEASGKILGEWKLKESTSEEYYPIAVINSTTEYTGTANDYYVFNDSGLLAKHSATGKIQVYYHVINPFQVRIGNQVWWVKQLTDTQLELLLDINEVVQDKRFVTKIYLNR